MPTDLEALERALAEPEASWTPLVRVLIAEVRELRAGVSAADKALVDWAHNAGWATGHGDTLCDMIAELKSQHCDERSYADLLHQGHTGYPTRDAALLAAIKAKP